MLRLLLALVLSAAAARGAPGAPERVEVPPMKTSIYVGSVTLATTGFVRAGEEFRSTYEAKVFPWFFWGEHGTISIRVPAADLEKLARGERIEFTGDALNHKGKPRRVTGNAEPADAAGGRIKVRIHVDDVALVFHGTYRFAAATADGTARID